MPHTRGPWHTDSAEPGVVFDTDGYWVADCYTGTIKPPAERDANARLCAAAPVLLTELQDAATTIERLSLRLAMREVFDISDQLTLRAVRIRALLFALEEQT